MISHSEPHHHHPAIASTPRVIGLFGLTMINVAVIISINNLPVMSLTGLTLVSYFLLAAFFFFLPTAFVSAELVTGWPIRGGFYSWVRIANGPHVGFFAIWLQWISNIIWYPSIIAPAVGTLAYLFAPQLAENKYYIFFSMVSIFWLITFFNFLGMKKYSQFSTYGVIFGSLVPGGLIILFGIIWILEGRPVQVSFHWHNLIPPFQHLDSFVYLIGLLVTLCGMEMSAVHAPSVHNPQKTYPRAIVLSVTIIMITSILAALAIAVVIPPHEVNLIAGIMQAFDVFLEAYHLSWLIPVMSILIFIGAVTMATVWISGPSKDLCVAAEHGDIPAHFRKRNKEDMPVAIFYWQAILFTLLSSVFLWMPSINSSYWILVALTAELYMIMYFVLFITGIRMRYKYPEVVRPYRIPGRKNFGMWLTAGAGMLGCTTAFTIGFIPPGGSTTLPVALFDLILISGILLVCVPPMIWFSIRYKKRKQAEIDHHLVVPTEEN